MELNKAFSPDHHTPTSYDPPLPPSITSTNINHARLRPPHQPGRCRLISLRRLLWRRRRTEQGQRTLPHWKVLRARQGHVQRKPGVEVVLQNTRLDGWR